MSSISSLIWFQLVDSVTGQPFKETHVTSILRYSIPVPIVDQFLVEVKKRYDQPDYLKDIPTGSLTVYENKPIFDKSFANEKEGKPLKLDLPIDGLGVSMEEALVVVVPLVKRLDATRTSGVLPTVSQNRGDATSRFMAYLKQGNINRPKTAVLNRIAMSFAPQMFAALEFGRATMCIDLYERVKDLPHSYTRGKIQEQMNISINGPLSLENPNVLIAVDLTAGKHIYIKLLRAPELSFSTSTLSRHEVVHAEVQNCTFLTQANILGLVQCEVVDVSVHDNTDLPVGIGLWKAIKMKRYPSALVNLPQLSEEWLKNGFYRILNALSHMHTLGLVHMDVKSDNIFVDENLSWDLGDFGSARRVGQRIWSTTAVLNPYILPSDTTVIPDMDFALLCVVIAIEKKKDKWKSLCGDQQHVQPDLVLKTLDEIKDETFKEKVVDLFVSSLKAVNAHLDIFKNQEPRFVF